MESLKRTVPLTAQISMPLVGLGTWQLKGDTLRPVIERAIQLGCRHIDCAAIYENEAHIGEILKNVMSDQAKFGVDRAQLFITSKLWNTMHSRDDVFTACEKTLKDLQLDYLDLYLIHWPFSFEGDGDGYSRTDENGVAVLKPVPLGETWAAMEELVRQGKVRAIGVSNFSRSNLKEILDTASIRPVANQIEHHPYLPQELLANYCEQNGIRLVAYSSLGSGKPPSLLRDPTIASVATQLGMTPAQVLLSWAYSREIPVIPRTSNPSRLEENFNLRSLAAKDIGKIGDIPTRFRYINPVDFWKRDCFDEDE